MTFQLLSLRRLWKRSKLRGLLLPCPQVNPVLKKCLEEQGLKFVGQDVGGERMEIVELEGEHGAAVGGGWER